MFNADMAYGISTWLGAEISTSGELLSGEVLSGTTQTPSVISGIITIQTTLDDMQTKLDALVGGTVPADETPVVVPAVLPAKAE